jgi:hypothetical protein
MVDPDAPLYFATGIDRQAYPTVDGRRPRGADRLTFRLGSETRVPGSPFLSRVRGVLPVEELPPTAKSGPIHALVAQTQRPLGGRLDVAILASAAPPDAAALAAVAVALEASTAG